MVDLRSDRFTGPLAHSGAEWAYGARPRRGIASAVSSDTTRAGRWKESANLDSWSQAFLTPAANLLGRGQAAGDGEFDQGGEAVEIELLHEPAAIGIDGLG